MLWKIVDTGGNQAIQFVVSVFLARMVMPEQFAAIAMLWIFINVANVFINSGFSTALIRTTDRTQADCCTVYYFNIVISLISYLVLYAVAPAVARFYDMQELCSILRVISIGIVIGAFGGVHRTLLQSDMEFRKLARINIAAALISGCIGVFLAYRGYQVWALAGQMLTATTIGTIMLRISSKWKATWEFSMQSLRRFFNFGSKLLASGLLDTLYNNMYSVVIGKFFPKSDLAFYNRAYSINNISSGTPTGVLQSVTFPALCKLQDSDERLRESYRNIIRVCSFVVFPLCLGVGAVSYPLVTVLFTDVWIYAAALLQIIVFGGIWYPIHAINLNLLQVKGRSDLFFRLEVIKKCLGVAILAVTFPLGLEVMCYGNVLCSVLCLIINTHYTGKLLNLGLLKQFRDFYPALILSIFMYACCKSISTLLGSDILSLIVSVASGAAIYLSVAYLLRFRALNLIKNINK